MQLPYYGRASLLDLPTQRTVTSLTFSSATEGEKHIDFAPCSPVPVVSGLAGDDDGGGGGGGGVDVVAPVVVHEAQQEEEEEEEASTHLCTICGLDFGDDTSAHRAHYKSQLHALNSKRVARGQSPLDDVNEDGEEDDDDDDDAQDGDDGGDVAQVDEDETQRGKRGFSRVLFTCSSGEQVEVWKTILQHPSQRVGDARSDLTLSRDALVALPETLAAAGQCTAVILISGGSFAGAVFQGVRARLHKTLHRYTVRRKQGGLQASKDAQSGTSAPKSAGSSLRRYNQARLEEDVRAVLEDWASALRECALILLFAPRSHRPLLFFPGSPLEKDDVRIRTIPIPVRKVTFHEAQRVLKHLFTVVFRSPQLESTSQADASAVLEQHALSRQSSAASSDGGAEPQVDETLFEPTRQVLAAVRGDDVEAVHVLLREHGDYVVQDGVVDSPLIVAATGGQVEILAALLDCDAEDVNCLDLQCRTPLHAACEHDHVDAMELLLERGADPTARDVLGRLAVQLLQSKRAKQALRRWAGEHESYVDWKAIGVQPLTKRDTEAAAEAAAKKRAKKREKEKARRKRKQAEKRAKQEAAAAAARAQEKAEELRKAKAQRAKQLNNMSDREKRALALERRLAASSGQVRLCDDPECGEPLVRVPFERLDFKYCSMRCLKRHRTALEEQ